MSAEEREVESSIIPLLASFQGGVAERLKRFREASAAREAGVVFRLSKEENHPVRGASVASRLFIYAAATPPCGDARRGMTHIGKEEGLKTVFTLVMVAFVLILPAGAFAQVNATVG